MSQNIKPKDTVTLIGTVSPNSKRRETFTFDSDATIENLRISTHVGQEYGLRYRVYVDRKESNRISLVTSLGDPWIGGNGSDFDFDVRREVGQGDTLVIEAENVTSKYSYHANARVSVDREGGAFGFLDNLNLGGVF